MKTVLLLLLSALSVSSCKYNLERNPDAWKGWDYSVHGTTSDGRKVVGDMTMDSTGAITGGGLIMDEQANEAEITVRKTGNNQMDGVDKDGITYKLTIDPLRRGEPAH
jgi:hypothetical protein